MNMHRLPIYAHEDEIVAAVREHPVVVVEGPAGTGKTTQLPRMIRRAGLVTRCMGITQPRRIAAVSVAWRIAQEEGVKVGDTVGYAIRFDNATSPQTAIKIMTDGILLQEARGDADLRAYDVVMVDEAHERSLNIDFVLGLLHRVLTRRHDLRVIISSATLYPGHFQRFFQEIDRNIPAVTVKTRTYPLDIQHWPLKHYGPDDIVEAVSEHVSQLHLSGATGHILVFLPGEGLIQKCEQAIAGQQLGPTLVTLPLYGRLTRDEQERIFADFGPNCRKVILATNIAETSITIEGVNYVIDCGLAKLPWFNPLSHVTTLREEPVSQASATQRAGRAGRLGPGTVIRLYDEKALAERPKFTPEEILRVDLSEAVLRLIDLGVRDVEAFPFPTPPPTKKIAAAVQTLQAMGAIDDSRCLTQIGRQMVPFPLSPSLARMVVEAANRFADSVSDVLLVGAYLSVRSPFLYPAGEEDAARRAQKRLADPLGDAITAVRAYRRWEVAADKTSFCEKNYLDKDTMAFIHKAHSQLCDIAESCGVQVHSSASNMEHVVRAVASGFAERVLARRGYTYETVGGLKVSLHPSSSLYTSPPQYIVAAELMSSGRTYAFNVSALKPEWLAEVNAQAARRWQVSNRPSSRRESPHTTTAASPTHLELGGVRLEVQARRRRPLVEIPLERVAELKILKPAHIPEASRRWRAKVSSPAGTLLRGALSYVVAMLPIVPWPDGDKGPGQLQLPPLGALLETDRNMHTLSRFLPAVTAPVNAGAPHPGWLALVGNGGGGFWYDVLGDYTDALFTSLDALDHLRKAEAETASFSTELQALQEKLEGQASAVQAAMAFESKS